MELILKIIFYINLFIIFWGMIGYPASIKVLGKIYSKRRVEKNYKFFPTVTVMVVAHNEEKVIQDKLENIIKLDYPKEKIEFLVSSDHSSDQTNKIVEEFIKQHETYKIRLYKAEKRKGKTNAQNEAKKLVQTEFLVMTDANAMLDKNAIKELIAAFTSDKIAYVCGKLVYKNSFVSDSSQAENNYWESDLAVREIESKIQTITAGNGALYACRTEDYYDFDPIQCHDSAMPLYYGLAGRRAIANHNAVAYEKAGEAIKDEFNRKIRMNRRILKSIIPDLRLLNVFHYRWFSYFYFGHRTCRYLLWIAHLLLFIINAVLAWKSGYYFSLFVGQVMFYLLAAVQMAVKSKNKYLMMIYYYVMTIAAQWVGVYRQLTKRAKPFWEKAESTR